MHLITTYTENKSNNLLKIFIYAILIRLLFLTITIIFRFSIPPTLYTDDLFYTSIAETYLSISRSLFDQSAFLASGGSLTDDPLYYLLITLVTFVTRSTLSLRLLNIIFSSLCIFPIYSIVRRYGNKKQAVLAIIIFSFLPYSIISSVFVIKDIFLMYIFLAVINQIDIFSVNKKKGGLVWIVLLLVLIFFSREGIAEITLLYFLITIFWKHLKKVPIVFSLISLIVLITLIYYNAPTYFKSIIDKIEYYIVYERVSSPLSIVRIDNVLDFYKIPFLYLFALIQPIDIAFPLTSWFRVLTFANLSLLPIGLSNLMYLILKRKYSVPVYWFTFLLFLGTIVLSIGISRHYLFLLPFSIINFVFLISRSTRKDIFLITALSFIFSMIIIAYYIFT